MAGLFRRRWTTSIRLPAAATSRRRTCSPWYCGEQKVAPRLTSRRSSSWQWWRVTSRRSSSAATAGFRIYACTLLRCCGCSCGLPTSHSRAPCLGQCLATTITSAHPHAMDGSGASAALPPAAMDGWTGPTSAAANAGSGASAMTPSAGSGLIIRI